MNLLTEILRWSLLIMSILDSYKYKLISNKISKLKSSKEHSRTFLNVSIGYRVLLLAYSFFVLKDWVLIWSCIIALYTLVEAFYTMFQHYPYKTRKLKNFKRPSLWKYTINSLIPNHIRKRL